MDLTPVPDEFDVVVPSAARIYDNMLGGGHNFEVDRQAAQRLLAAVPARDMARLNRSFLRRAVLFLIDAGIRQFLDLGSGISTVGNVHEVRRKPTQRVACCTWTSSRSRSRIVSHCSQAMTTPP
jgi:hypothetical protein